MKPALLSSAALGESQHGRAFGLGLNLDSSFDPFSYFERNIL